MAEYVDPSAEKLLKKTRHFSIHRKNGFANGVCIWLEHCVSCRFNLSEKISHYSFCSDTCTFRSLCLNAKCVFVTIIYTVDPVTIVYASTVQLAMRLKPFYILAKFAKKSEQQTNKQENERKWLERECVRLKEKWDSMKGTWGWQCTSAVLCVLFVYVVSIFCISIFACCNGNVIS